MADSPHPSPLPKGEGAERAQTPGFPLLPLGEGAERAQMREGVVFPFSLREKAGMRGFVPLVFIGALPA